MADGLPRRLLHQSDERDGDVGEHEKGEGEHVADLLRRGGADGVPFHEGGEHAEDEHEHDVVAQAEHDRGHRARDGHARGHDPRGRQHDDNGVE